MHARVQIQRGALPRAIWSGWISIWDASGQGINRSPQPCDKHKRAWVPLSCASALPRRCADHAVPGQGPRPNKGQWNGTPPGEPGGERPGGPGERARGGRARGRSRGMLFTPVFTGGGRVACSSPALRSARPPGLGPPRGDQSIELTRSSSLTAAASVLRSCCGASAPIVINGASRMSLCL